MALIGVAGFIGVIVFCVMFFVAVIKGSSKKTSAIGMAVCFVLILFAAFGTTRQNDEDKQTAESKNSEPSPQAAESVKSEAKPSPQTPVLNESLDISGYLEFDSEVLFEYGNYFGGENVVTVISAYQSGSSIKAQTDNNNDGYFYSLMFEFEDKDIPKQVEEGDVLTIAGTIKEKPATVDFFEFLESPTVTLENCSIVGFGEIAQVLKDGVPDQQALGAQRKAQYEAQVAAEKKAERDDYIAQCQTVGYSDVERNPDKYDGTKIKIIGNVVQVSEGFFDSVTLRVNCGGNMWYVTYKRSEGEGRILEGDRITGYGECNGVTSYTNVLGSQVTIPSMRMEYYD